MRGHFGGSAAFRKNRLHHLLGREQRERMERLMKKLAILLLLLSVSGWAAVARVQGRQGDSLGCGSSGLTQTCAFTSNVTAHNGIVACAQANSSASSMTIASAIGNTFTAVSATLPSGGGINKAARCWVAKDIAAGAETVTVTDTQNVVHEVFIEEYSGGSTTSLLGASVTSTGVGTTMSSGALTVTSGSLVVSFIFGDGAFTSGNGFSTIGTAARGNDIADKTIVGTDGSATWTSGAADWGMITFEIKAAGGAPVKLCTLSLMGVGPC
ncbi:MAG: hypothetical protein JWN45_2943 [Acidobacteriaceae bacterium]|nr:hypothetical protein [Acidobacteriaceae bacterium]